MKTIKQIDSEFVKWGKKYMKTNFVQSGKIKAGRGKTTSASFTWQKEFDKEFGNDLEKRDGVCQPQPCDCCNNISLKIKNFISTLIKAEHGYYICPQCGATAKKVNWKEYKQIKKKYNLYG